MNTRILLLLSFIFLGCQGGGSESSPADFNLTGKGGSMARFAISGKYLYTLSNENLGLFDISNPANPVAANSVRVGSAVETIFPYKDNLFFGTQNGMLIYDNSDPMNPRYVSEFEHITSCDPVVVEGNYAYVTLRNGTRCNWGVNRLDIVDLDTITLPKLVASYAMSNPHGLGIDRGTLFICDGFAGLKVYDASDPMNLKLLKRYPGINTYDVIPNRNLLIMSAKDGIYQYDYSNPDNIEYISKIAIN